MSNYLMNIPMTKIIQKKEEDDKQSKKKAKSQFKYINVPDIITQVKPSYLNNFIRPINLRELSLAPINNSNNIEEYLLPPKSKEFSNKKTLILDLDETLVHSSFTPFQKNDIILEVDFDGVIYNIYVLIRPYAEEFLKNVSKYFEVVVFTASISKYASPLLDILDKDKNIKHRLFRDHCTFVDGIFRKELKRLNRCLKDLIIVDNSPSAYAFDSDNGLPIKTWYDDPNDRELMKIEPLIIFLSKTKDVRKYIDRFVDDDEILYNEAMAFIDYIEKNNIDILNDSDNNEIDIVDSGTKDNNEKFFDEKNKIINNNNQINDYKINASNMMKNIKLGLFSFNNLTRIKNYKTINDSSSSQRLNNTNKEINNMKPIENIKNENSSSINQFKIIGNQSENNINNKDKKNSQNKKQNIGILLRQQSSKKRNIFLLSQRPNETNFSAKINNINGFNKNFATNSFYNNYNTLKPLILPFSNSTKNNIQTKKTLSNNNTNKINIFPIHMIKNGINENKKKQKFINLLDKFDKNGNIKRNEIKNNFNFPKNINNEKVSSSITSYRNNFMSIRLNQNDNKDAKNEYLKIPKSNSINNVLKLHLSNKNNLNNNLEAKTPNRHPMNIFQKDNNNNYYLKYSQKEKNLFNFIKGIEISKTKRSKYINSAHPYGKRNNSKSIQRKNK